ncbi:MAG: hypothetical protein IJS14_11790 [Lentisphaeria bacterium]|nr:hypothetical protein [Lentisphaeria bacterium]
MNERTAPKMETAEVSAEPENSIWLSEFLKCRTVPADREETPKQKITLVRAFKERTRIVRQMQKAIQLLKEENSVIEGGVRSIEIRQTYAEYTRLCAKLIELKKAISRANAGIVDRLVELAEIKGICQQINYIPVKEGKQEARYEESESQVFVADLKKAEIAAEREALHARMDALQDEIDEFNARTLIEFEP